MTDRFQSLMIPAKPASVPVLRQHITAGQGAIGIMVAVLSGASLIYVHESFGVWPTGAFVFLTPLLLKLVALFHEIGHAAAGRAAGMRLLAISVGSWRGQPGHHGWQFGRAKRVKGMGGFVLMLPKDGEITVTARSVYMLGGPCANLIFGLACVWAAYAFDIRTFVGLALLYLASISVLMGFINLIPFKFGGWSSDGRQLWDLWVGVPDAQVTEYFIRLGGLSMVGVRPRDWPEFNALGSNDTRLSQSSADALRRCVMIRAIDAGATDDPAAHAAAVALSAGFWQGPDGIRQMNALALATWEMLTRRDLAIAQAWLAESEGALMDQSCQSNWVRAAIATGQGQWTEARTHIATSRVQMGELEDLASQLMLSDLLNELELKLSSAACALIPQAVGPGPGAGGR